MEVGDADFVVLIVKLVEEGVEAFGRVVDASGIGRMQDVRFASSRKDDIDVTLGDLSSGSSVAVDPHGSQVDDMSVDLRVDDGTAQVVVAGHVVFDSVPLLLGSLHGIRSGALFRKVHDRIGLFVLDELHKQVIILGHVQIDELHVLARHLLPRLHADLRRLDGSERVASQFVVDVAPGQVVHYHDIVAHVREVEGGGPSAEAVAAEDDHLLFLKLAIGGHVQPAVHPRPLSRETRETRARGDGRAEGPEADGAGGEGRRGEGRDCVGRGQQGGERELHGGGGRESGQVRASGSRGRPSAW
mmetsp:Transcript_34295/g.79279  ORF Transcript_34295/g.79279 Transcript_34295/m.79279 type:complete len:301 (-) Transcript_34295:110-1012(-)